MDRRPDPWQGAGADAGGAARAANGVWPDGMNTTAHSATSAPPDPELDPPFDVLEPTRLVSAVVLSSPHSGRVYPARFLAAARLDAASLRRSEDVFVDELFAPCTALGVPLLRARFPRAYLDANREPYELDPGMFEGRLPPYANTRSIRVAGGLGTIARVVGDAQEIYGSRLRVEDGLRRIEGLHKPYHAALQALTDRAVHRFGLTLLLDCHSMPSCSQGGTESPTRPKADFVLGDRFGTSCHRSFTDAAEYELKRCGYGVARNKPYAGGYITERHGQPAAGRHALQIEINRALYMDERDLLKLPCFDTVIEHLGRLVRTLVGVAEDFSPRDRAAAE